MIHKRLPPRLTLSSLGALGVLAALVVAFTLMPSYGAQQTAAQAIAPGAIVAVPNSHGTSTGWLVGFDAERNYMANNYADHLRRLAVDPNYVVAISEPPHLIALNNLRPEVMPILRRGLRDRRVELVNAFFVETDANLQLGETLLRTGVEGVEWQRERFGVSPRFGWFIDVLGVHRQIPEVLAQLGLDAFVYGRNPPLESPVQRWVAPSGAQVLGFYIHRYANWRSLFDNAPPNLPLLRTEVDNVAQGAAPDAPLLWLVGRSDYSPAPARATATADILALWTQNPSPRSLQFSTPSSVLDHYRARPSLVDSLPTVNRETIYSYNAFWSNAPRMKQQFRQSEQEVLAAEALAALAAVTTGHRYPSDVLHDAWLALIMNSDRGLLWGAGAGAPFYGAGTWNAQDRFDLVRERAGVVQTDALAAMTDRRTGTALSVSNPTGVEPHAVIDVPLPTGRRLQGLRCERIEGERRGRCMIGLAPFAVRTVSLEDGDLETSVTLQVPRDLTTAFYRVILDESTGFIRSLSLRDAGPPLMDGSVLMAERQRTTLSPADFLVARENRTLEATSAGVRAATRFRVSELGWTIESRFAWIGGADVRRVLTFFRDDPRIDVTTEITDLPDGLLVSDNVRLPAAIDGERRGIPYGFAERSLPDSVRPPERFLTPDHAPPQGLNNVTVPAVGWSAHETRGVGLAIFDRGVPARESNGATATILLMNTSPNYRGLDNAWLSGRGRQVFHYSLLPYLGDWRAQSLPQRAIDFAAPAPVLPAKASLPFLQSAISSSDNFLVESVRVIGRELEVRGVETFGRAGLASITLRVPHSNGRRTNALGEGAAELGGENAPDSGRRYDFAVAPQQIVTLRFGVSARASKPTTLTNWSRLVPTNKRSRLMERRRELVGHPPE